MPNVHTMLPNQWITVREKPRLSIIWLLYIWQKWIMTRLMIY